MSPGGNAQLGDVFKDYFLDHLSLCIWGTIVQSEKINSKLSPSKQDGKITFPILSFSFYFFFLKKAYFWKTGLKICFHLDTLAGFEHLCKPKIMPCHMGKQMNVQPAVWPQAIHLTSLSLNHINCYNWDDNTDHNHQMRWCLGQSLNLRQM